VARLVNAPVYAERPNLTCIFYTYWAGVPIDFEIYERPGSWVAALRTHDDLTLVAAYMPQARFAHVRRDAKSAYLADIMATAPALWQRLADATMVDRLYGTGDQRNFFRRAHGPGWVLVGDAGHHKDSINAHGITDAFLQSDLLAHELGGGDDPTATLGDPARLDAALSRFAAARDEQMYPTYQTNLLTARLDPSPDRLPMLRAIQDSAELVERYFSVVAGILSPEDLFTKDLLARL
jgi:flavin-dependent dehydrogenase